MLLHWLRRIRAASAARFAAGEDGDDNDEEVGAMGDAGPGAGSIGSQNASQHSYLGELRDLSTDTAAASHRALHHEPGTILELPLLPMPGVVLFPGETLPLRIFRSGPPACRPSPPTYSATRSPTCSLLHLLTPPTPT